MKLSLQDLGLFLCICPLTWGSFQGYTLGLDAMGGSSCEDRVLGWGWGVGVCVAPGDTQLREGSRRLKGCRWLRQTQGRIPLRHCGHRDLVILGVEGHPGPWGVEQPPWLLHVPGAPSPDEHRCPRWGLASPRGTVASLGTLLWDLAERWGGRLGSLRLDCGPCS